MDEKKVNTEKKLWESAYSVLNHPRTGPYMHGAGMVERTTGVTHYWLVRGPCTQSVVRVLQGQLTQAYRGRSLPSEPTPAQTPPPPEPKPEAAATDRTLASLVLLGLCSWIAGTLVGHK